VASALAGGLASGAPTSTHLLTSHTPPAEALTSGFHRALLASSIFRLAAAVVALRVTNAHGETQQPVAEAPPDLTDHRLFRAPDPALEDAA